MSMPKNLKNVSLRSYMFDDYDDDGYKNIDDRKPFNKNNGEDKPNPYKSSFQDNNVPLSAQLLHIERANNAKGRALKTVLSNNPGAYGRVKSVPSTMKKLVSRFLEPTYVKPENRKKKFVGIFDLAAATVETNTRAEATKISNQIPKRYNTDRGEYDDFYKHPKASHSAYHHSIIIGKKDRVELQIQSHKMADLDERAHPYYKHGKVPMIFIKENRRLYKMGY